LSFDEASIYSSILDIQDLQLQVLTTQGLIKAKKASNRPKDQQDIIELSKKEEE